MKLNIKQKSIKIITVLTLICGISFTSYSQYATNNTPFMLFVAPLLPPQGKDMSVGFSKACFDELKKQFKNSAYQPIIVKSKSIMNRMSNQKHDIIISSDIKDYYYSGNMYDTLVVWAKFKVGLLRCRIEIPFSKNNDIALPAEVAKNVDRVLKKEMLGEVHFDGGPRGMTILITKGARIWPPRTIFLPSGDYFMVSSYPGFKVRRDTIQVFPGRTIRKRILLLPEQ